MELFSIFKKSDTLYFPGCLTYFKFNEKFEAYKKVFSKLGIKFRVIDKQVCCGLPALEAGYEQETRKLARRNFEIFKEENIKEIVTNAPCCYKMFLKNYPEILPDWDIKIKNLWEIILNSLEKNPKVIKECFDEEVTYHDSCYLGRHCEVYSAPRKIIEMLGYKIKEMTDSKENSICCGSCGGLPRIDLELANKIARQRLLQAKRTGVKKIFVASLDNYQLLKKNSEEIGIEVLDLLEVLACALGIKIKDKDTKEEGIEDIKINEDVKEELKEEIPEENEYE